MLKNEVPRLDVAAVKSPVSHRIPHLTRRRQRKSSLADIRAADRWNTHTGAERPVGDARRYVSRVGGDRLVAVDAGEGSYNRQWIPATQRLGAPRVRVVGDAVSASNNRGIR